ncbi:hypothetical protein Dimus_035419, partial [Dionaea muscipula]
KTTEEMQQLLRSWRNHKTRPSARTACFNYPKPILLSRSGRVLASHKIAPGPVTNTP